MNRRIKRTIQIVVIFCVTLAFVLVASNRTELINYFSKCSYYCLEQEDLTFYNWETKGDNYFLSQEDPQLILYGLDTYVNNIHINATFGDGAKVSDEILIYYTEKQGDSFSADKCIAANIDKSSNKVNIGVQTKVYDIRIDLTEIAGVTLIFDSFEINPQRMNLNTMDILLWIVMLVGVYTVFHFRRFMAKLYEERELILTLVRNDLKSRYAGSFFGLIWAFVQPCMTILVFWLVFELGFRTLPINNVKFILWFVPAYIPWIFFSDAVVNSSNCLREYSYLVKKMKFPIEILPVVKVFSSLVIHLFFIVLMSIIYIFYRYGVTLMALQIMYYVFALTCLLVGIAWLTSAISVFMKDFTQIISIALQLGFFMIPIFWNDADMSSKVLFFLKFNPAFYLVQGYRDSMINNIFFWERPVLTAYYWIITILVFVLGIKMFEKLRKHFADLI